MRIIAVGIGSPKYDRRQRIARAHSSRRRSRRRSAADPPPIPPPRMLDGRTHSSAADPAAEDARRAHPFLPPPIPPGMLDGRDVVERPHGWGGTGVRRSCELDGEAQVGGVNAHGARHTRTYGERRKVRPAEGSKMALVATRPRVRAEMIRPSGGGDKGITAQRCCGWAWRQ